MTYAGTSDRDGGPALSAFLNLPEGLAISGAGNILVADTGDMAARRFSVGGAISTVGQVQAAPHGVAVDAAGDYYVSDDEPLVLKITPAGVTSIVAGISQDGYSGDGGPATAAMISMPTGVAVDSGNNVYFTDYNNNRIRRVSASGTITTIAGNGRFIFSGDNGPALSAGLDPLDVAVDTRRRTTSGVADQHQQSDSQDHTRWDDRYRRGHRSVRLRGRWRAGDFCAS